MPSIKYKKRKKIKFFLISIIIIFFFITVAVFINYRKLSGNIDKYFPLFDSKANISIGNVHQIATKNGILEWNLEAFSVHYINNENKAIFNDIIITFFLKNKKKVYLTAKKGILAIDSNDLEASGNVVVRNDIYTLATEKLFYKHAKKNISTNEPVKISGNAMQFLADSMSYDINTGIILLKGNIQGIIFENKLL